MVDAVGGRTSQFALLVPRDGSPSPRMTGLIVLAAYTPPAVKLLRTVEVAALAAYRADVNNVPKTTEMCILAAYKTGLPGSLTTRAWTFDLDGHTFYVLGLGIEGTFLYDTISQQWCKFETAGYGVWNMFRGIMWNNRVIAADATNPFVWELDPNAVLDEEWREVDHVLTGGLPRRARAMTRNDSFRLATSPGVVGVDGALMKLRFSDDQGRSWTQMEDIVLVQGDYVQEVAWRSLGAFAAPGRVFEVSDSGGVIRINGANADIDGVDDAD